MSCSSELATSRQTRNLFRPRRLRESLSETHVFYEKYEPACPKPVRLFVISLKSEHVTTMKGIQ